MVRVSFRFTSCHFAFVSFPKISSIFAILPLYMACKMWKITGLSWEISSCRVLENFHISAFPCIILYIVEMKSTKLRNWKKKSFESRKKTKTRTKRHGWKVVTQQWTFWYLQQCACANAIYFAPLVTTTYCVKNNKSSTRGLSLEISVLARARAQLLDMLYIST